MQLKNVRFFLFCLLITLSLNWKYRETHCIFFVYFVFQACMNDLCFLSLWSHQWPSISWPFWRKASPRLYADPRKIGWSEGNYRALIFFGYRLIYLISYKNCNQKYQKISVCKEWSFRMVIIYASSCLLSLLDWISSPH